MTVDSETDGGDDGVEIARLEAMLHELGMRGVLVFRHTALPDNLICPIRGEMVPGMHDAQFMLWHDRDEGGWVGTVEGVARTAHPELQDVRFAVDDQGDPAHAAEALAGLITLVRLGAISAGPRYWGEAVSGGA